MDFARYAWLCCATSAAIWALTLLLFVLQLNGKLGWAASGPLWLAMGLAPFGLLAGYLLVGEPLRAVGFTVAAFVLLGGAFGLGMTVLSEDAGVILTIILAAACSLALPLAGWCTYDTHRRGTPVEQPDSTQRV